MPGANFDHPMLGGSGGFDALTQAVVDAGDEALRMFEAGRATVTRKPDDSPVTAADKAVEQRLLSFVTERFPTATFYGEETGESTGGGSLRFIVDPIDGTRAYMRGLSTWSVLMGVEEEGKLIAALAYLPAQGELYRAQAGRGAFLGEQPLRVSAVGQLADALVCHGSLGQFRDDDLLTLLPLLASRTYTQRCLGDFAGYAALLKGQADLVIDPAIQPYDVAPAALLVTEAGGRFSDLTGAKTIHGRGGLASNGLLHRDALALIKRAWAGSDP